MEAKKAYEAAHEKYLEATGQSAPTVFPYGLFGGRQGRPRKEKRTEATLGKQMDKMRILLPLFKGMDIKPNLRRLVMSQVGL
jgi:hypothetical protein